MILANQPGGARAPAGPGAGLHSSSSSSPVHSLNTSVAIAGTSTDRDCGSNALFVLLHLEGRGASLQELDDILPTRHPKGYSLEELARSSKRLGLELEGQQLRRRDLPLKRPAIAFSQSPSGGHFSVLRPIGTTGTMAQVIDPPHPTRIVDYSELMRMPSWTGRILVVADPWWKRYGLGIACGIAGAAILIASMFRCRDSCPPVPKPKPLTAA